MAFQFRLSLPLTLATITVVLICGRLSLWQFERAEQKRELEELAQSSLSSAPTPFIADKPITIFQASVLSGQFMGEDIFLDNRIHQRLFGYHVITPFRLESGDFVMVNRGWIQAHGDRSILPSPSAPPDTSVTISGFFYPDDKDDFILADIPETAPRRQRLVLSQLKTELNLPLLPFVFIQHTPTDSDLVPVSIVVDYKSAQSTAYAWQWFSFAVLALIFYVLLSRKRLRS